MAAMSVMVDSSRPVRSRSDQQALARAVFEASAGTQETDWLEWKGPLDLAAAGGRAAIAKAVLGFSNRNPDLAARNMGGCAYFLAGVTPGALAGVAAVDGAQLEGQVAPFVGRDVSWRADYVDVDGRNVLVVTVEPPQWGDQAHPARKTYNPAGGGSLAFQEGTVFVRHQASTERATAADVDMLSRRAARRGGDQLAVDVRPAPETSLRSVDISPEAIAAYIEQEERRLLAPLARTRHAPSEAPLLGISPLLQASLAFGSHGGEYRSEDGYRKDVSRYLDELREQLPDVLPVRALLHKVARLKLEVVNDTDTTFTGVRVEALLPAEFDVTEWPEGLRRDGERPTAPIVYGYARGGSGLGLYSGLPAIRSLMPVVPFTRGTPDVESRVDGTYVEYVPKDVRAQGVTPLPSVWLRIEDPLTVIPVRWEATATNADLRLSGTFSAPVVPTVVTVAELMADVPDDD